MKQNICELDTMIFFREALEAHEFMLLPVMASAVVECRTADKELKTLNEDGEIGLARLFSIWANMMCAPGAATIVGCRPITMLSEILAQVHAYLTVHPLYDPEGLALYVELHHMMDAILMGDGLNKEPRLRFTDEERADPALEKPIRKTEKAAARADKAQANIPKKKVRQTVIDPDTGKKTSKLTFEDKKKPPSKLSQGVKEAPVHLVAGKFHKEIRETEQDNVGVESAHKSEEAVETSAYLVREGYRSHKLKPYRKAAQAEQKLEKANVNALYQKSLQENPQFASNPLSRWQQKQSIKKQYAVAKRSRSDCRKYRPGCVQTGKRPQGR